MVVLSLSGSPGHPGQPIHMHSNTFHYFLRLLKTCRTHKKALAIVCIWREPFYQQAAQHRSPFINPHSGEQRAGRCCQFCLMLRQSCGEVNGLPKAI